MLRHMRWIASYWRGHRAHISVLLVLTVVSSGVALGFPLVFRYVLDNLEQVMEGGSMLRRVMLILGALALGRFVAGLYPGARAWLNSKIGLDVRDDVFDSLKEKDYRFWGKFRPGDLTTRLTDDIVEYPRIGWFSCSAVFRALESSARLLFCLVVMVLISWELTLLAVAPLPLMIYIFYRVEHRLGKKVEESRRATSYTNDLLDSTFAGISIVKAYGAEEGQKSRLRRLLDRRVDIEMDIARLMMLVHSLYNFIGHFGKVLVVLVGGILVIRQRIGLGDFYAFYVYLDLLLAPMMDIPNLFVTSRQAFASIDREVEILEFPDRVRRLSGEDPGPLRTVELRGAGFRYPEGPGLEGIHLRVEAPAVVAVVGEVGSGKTTLLKMLAGLLPAGEGEVLLNGVPLEHIPEDALSARVGYVPQESVLFSETVAENVRLGRPIGDERVAAALETAGLPAGELHMGARRLLGQGGTGVSGGQRQRVAIARALAGGPSLLLLDDCTAALDAEREEALWKRLGPAASGAITFVVTHREATVKHADRVVLLHRGRLAAAGTHERLRRESRLYRWVLSTEMSDAGTERA